jgi:hypothetical protein
MSRLTRWIQYEQGQYRATCTTQQEQYFYNFERSFINILEAIRKPVYDTIHAANLLNIEFYHGDRLLDELFHLKKEAWSKEKDAHRRKWKRYRPETNYVPQSILCADGRYVAKSGERVPRLRQRWGYGSFRELLGVDDDHDEDSEEDDGDGSTGQRWHQENCSCCGGYGEGGVSDDDDKYWPL